MVDAVIGQPEPGNAIAGAPQLTLGDINADLPGTQSQSEATGQSYCSLHVFPLFRRMMTESEINR